MFIRKRTTKLKNGQISETYQAVESYRMGGKIKQRVVSLGEFSDPKEALKQEQLYLKTAEKNYKFPLSDWYETRNGPGNNLCRVKLTEKQVLKKREFWRKICQYHRKRVGILDSTVSKVMRCAGDTTNFKMSGEKENYARDSYEEIKRMISSR